MCQYGGQLDYVIAIDVNSQELRIIRLKYNSILNESFIIDYKKVDKDINLILSGNVYVDCHMTEQFLGINTYTIGILGQYFQQNLLSNYYFAKFSTKYNLTEYFIKSNDLTTMEIPKGVRIDLNNKLIYLAIEINKNKYHDRTVYLPGDLPPIDNSNVAIVAYSWTHGTRLWVSVVGDTQLVDHYGDMECYGNYLYVVINSFSTKYTTNSSSTDINYYRMRASNGFIEGSQIFGSPKDDLILDLQVNHIGVYMLAIINTPFQPHRQSSKQWQTQNQNQNIAIILMDFTDQIIEIEGYDLSTFTLTNPYPTRFFITRSAGGSQQYIFISHRTNNIIDKKGGIFITYFNNQNSVFRGIVSCNANCAFCNPKVPNLCLVCSPNYLLFQYQCSYLNCPQFSYSVIDSSLAQLNFCKPCHYSCLTCNGPSPDQCSSCCQNAICGATYDRVPNSGVCSCPLGTLDSNGICASQCALNLQGQRGSFCYTQCPMNSYPELKYDQLTAQPVSQFDATSPSSIENYVNQLKFQQAGKGLPVSGPTNFQSIPSEFTLSFWVFPISINTKSTFINAFNRIKVFASSSSSYAFYNFMTGPISFVQPTYFGTNQQLLFNSWNYIAVSQRNIKSGGQTFYEIQMALAQSMANTALNAGYSNTLPYVNYASFSNIIYLGADSDISPGSFTGYLKEVKIFNQFHSLSQMITDQTKLYRLYSYDDQTLVSYWKLSEPYTNTDIQYVINDYSFNQNSLTYSIFANPDYPTFLVDSPNQLTLYTVTDVKICRSVDYEQTSPIQTSPQRLMEQPTWNLIDLSIIKTTGDKIRFMMNNTDCQQQIQAEMIYSTLQGGWTVPTLNLSPYNLLEGQHYQVCYYYAKDDVSFNLMQIYLVFRPRTIDPSTQNIYNRTGNLLQWMTDWGDQTQGDIIRFMTDCNNPIINETEIIRSNTPDYQILLISEDFLITGDFYFCWYPVFNQDFMNQPYFEFIHNLKFVVQNEPWLNATQITAANMNEDMILFQLHGTFIDGDKFTMAWGGLDFTDCQPTNFLGQIYTYNNSYWPGVWVGYTTGIHGFNTYQNFMDELQACWQPSANQAPVVFIRIKKFDMKPYVLKVNEYKTISNQLSPELVSFNPEYGSSTLIETDTMIRFNFKPMRVYPAKLNAGQLGKLIIYRGAIMDDGQIVKIQSSIFWQNLAFDENHLPDPQQQGDLLCSQTGQCAIILSSSTNQLKAGEIYFLSFFTYSFANIVNGVKYYLFDDKPITFAQSAYDHLFFCRSFTIFPSNQLINGNTLIILGTDLLQKTINSKYVGGTLQQDTFYTKAINLKLKVFNTDSPFCKNNPIATVAMQDVTNQMIKVNNLVLRQCNSGQLFADIEIIRGIRDQYGQFTYVRGEKMYNVELGSIGCDSSCQMCNGTQTNNCVLCQDTTYFLYMGTCQKQCPTNASFYILQSITFQSVIYQQNTCVQKCPFQSYPQQKTGQCLPCNKECQQCNNNTIASCLSCNPVAYLYNGICLSQCPTIHHVDNYTDYICHQISTTQYLKVKILSTGYLYAIPKEKTIYLKVDIDNTGGGNITSITWSQLQPDPLLGNIVFGNDIDGSHSYQSQIVRLDNSALGKIKDVIQVMCTVTNSIGEIQYDIYEFYLNDSPLIGTMKVTFVGEDSQSTGQAMKSLLQIDLNQWYDSSDDTEQNLKLKVYFILTQSVGTAQITQQMTLTEQLSQNKIFVKLPPLSNNNTSVNITICVNAEDLYYAINYQCVGLLNVKNDLIYTQNYDYLVNEMKKLNFTRNISNVLFAAQIIFLGIQIPYRMNNQPNLCTLDVHCNYNGYCNNQIGILKCICIQGFQGSYCQFQNHQLQALKQISNAMLDELQYNISHSQIVTSFTIEVIANVLRGICNVPDLITDQNLERIIELLEVISNADLYAHQNIDQNTTAIIFQAYSNVMMKVYHSYKIRNANPDNSLSASGVSILKYSQQINVFSLQSTQNVTQRVLDSSFQEFSYYQESDQKQCKIGCKQHIKQRQLLMEAEYQMYQDWGRRVDVSFNAVLDRYIYKLDPNLKLASMATDAFQFYIQNINSTYIGQNPILIQQNDAYWIFPTNIFYNQQGLASPIQEIKIKLIKYVNNPFMYEINRGAHMEQNITSVQFFTQGNKEIKINLNGTNQYIDQREPFKTNSGFAIELLRCMIWDDQSYKFVNDLSCGFSFINDQLPQISYDPAAIVVTQVSQCRCTHLTKFGVVFQKTIPLTQGKGLGPGIYSNFIAIQYWTTSFGVLVVLGGMVTFITGHIVFYIIDQRLQKNLLIQLKEQVRKFEIKYGKSVRRLDGMFYIPEREQLKYAKKRRLKQKEKEDDEKGLMNETQNDDDTVKNEIEKQENKNLVNRKGKKRFLPKKKFKQDDLVNNLDEPDQEAAIQIPVKGKKLLFKNKPKKVNQDNLQNETSSLKNQEIVEEEKGPIEEEKMNTKEFEEDRKLKEIQQMPDYLTDTQKKQLISQKKVLDKIKSARDQEHLLHILLRIKAQDVEGMTKKEFKRKIMKEKKKFKGDQLEDIEDKFENIVNQLNSTDEEIYQGLREHFVEEEILREQAKFQLKNMIIEGSHILSLFFITSILFPRHVRWSLTFACLVLVWFITAVIINNTQNPLQIPDLSKKASSQATKQLWIGIFVPFGVYILMYIISSFLKMTNAQILYCSTLKQLDLAMIELKKEMRLRFTLGYSILFVIIAYIFWYVIEFTATFGWKVSWIWWYCGCFGVCIQFVVYDNLISLAHYGLYKFNKRLGWYIMKMRTIKQAYCEILKNPFENEEDQQMAKEIQEVKSKIYQKEGFFSKFKSGNPNIKNLKKQDNNISDKVQILKQQNELNNSVEVLDDDLAQKKND